MMDRTEILKHVLQKLAEMAPNENVQLEAIRVLLENAQNQERQPKRPAVAINPLRAPTPSEAREMQSYNQAGLIGAITGTAAGTIGGKLLRRNILASAGLGAGTGLLAALVRHFDQKSDPPGLSPVYTVPAGASLGALTGAASGAGLGRLSRFGVVPGALLGAAAGATGGAAVSGMV